MLRKNPNSVANGRKPCNLFEISRHPKMLIEQAVQVVCNLSGWILNRGAVGSSNVRLVKSHSRSGWRLWGIDFLRGWCLWVLNFLNTRFESADIVLQNLNLRPFLTSCVFAVFNSIGTIALTADWLLSIASLCIWENPNQ